jgi:hypothetical protein
MIKQISSASPPLDLLFRQRLHWCRDAAVAEAVEIG